MTRLADIPSQPFDSYDEHSVKVLVEQLLSRRQFVGVFMERRWVASVNDYRDVIILNKNGNDDLVKDLNHSVVRLKEFYGKKWIGITGPNCVGAPTGHCLWVATSSLPLGEHEFRIQKVRFTENEIYVKIKSLRLIDGNINSSNENISESDLANEPEMDSVTFEEKIKNILEVTYELLTVKNVKMFFSLFFAFSVHGVSSFFSFIQWLGDFTIRLFREFSHLVQVIMPLLLAIVELVRTLFGAMFVTFAMFFRAFMTRNHDQARVNFSSNSNRFDERQPLSQYPYYRPNQQQYQNNYR